MKGHDYTAILREQIRVLYPPKMVLEMLYGKSDEFLKRIDEALQKKNIRAEVFLGGSLAKGTIIKENVYDVDIFVRFFEQGKKSFSDILASVLGSRFKRLHGSRDYFQNRMGNVLIEVIPVMRIASPKEAHNVTDLSYFHVNYVLDKIKKNDSLKQEIVLAKTFCHAQRCYGAESYINGLSGYALELLICHYGSFLNFIKAVSIVEPDQKIIIDDSHFYDDEQDMMRELNISKQQSPIILIDPTFRERNALAGLSMETFARFQTACRAFLKHPSPHFFIVIDLAEAFKKYKNVKIVAVKTDKQAGDIAGTKSKKFFGFMFKQLQKEFVVHKANFEYDEQKNLALFYFAVLKKEDELVKGPALTYPKHVAHFKKTHSHVIVKNGVVYAMVKHALSFDKWFNEFSRRYKKIIREMNVRKIDIAIEKKGKKKGK
ncbi:MAG: nucleotidyltransferase domain-containing protein [Nanoarchaeota archaeon]